MGRRPSVPLAAAFDALLAAARTDIRMVLTRHAGDPVLDGLTVAMLDAVEAIDRARRILREGR